MCLKKGHSDTLISPKQDVYDMNSEPRENQISQSKIRHSKPVCMETSRAAQAPPRACNFEDKLRVSCDSGRSRRLIGGVGYELDTEVTCVGNIRRIQDSSPAAHLRIDSALRQIPKETSTTPWLQKRHPTSHAALVQSQKPDLKT